MRPPDHGSRRSVRECGHVRIAVVPLIRVIESRFVFRAEVVIDLDIDLLAVGVGIGDLLGVGAGAAASSLHICVLRQI